VSTRLPSLCFSNEFLSAPKPQRSLPRVLRIFGKWDPLVFFRNDHGIFDTLEREIFSHPAAFVHAPKKNKTVRALSTWILHGKGKYCVPYRRRRPRRPSSKLHSHQRACADIPPIDQKCPTAGSLVHELPQLDNTKRVCGLPSSRFVLHYRHDSQSVAHAFLRSR